MFLVEWLPFAILAALCGAGFRESVAYAIWQREPFWHYALCYFAMVVCLVFGIGFVGETWRHLPWKI